MSDFLDLLSQRHAAEQFDPTASITRSEIETLVQEASQAPSTFNLQHWRFVAITDPQIRAQLSTTTIPPNRQRVVDASVIFVILGDLEAHRSLSEILEQSVKAGTLTREIADLWESTANQLYGANPHFARERWFGPSLLLRWCSCSQPAIMGLPVARSDSLRICYEKSCGPAIGNIPLMMITVGRDASINRKRRSRLPVSQILSFDAFTEFSADKTIEAARDAE